MGAADHLTSSLYTLAETAVAAGDWNAFRRLVEQILPRVEPRLELLGAFALQLVEEGDVISALDIWGHFVDAARLGGAQRASPPQ